MRCNCIRCNLLYSDATKGYECINKYCSNHDICESCSNELGLSLYNRECNICITYGAPTWFDSWVNWLIVKRIINE